MGTEIFIPLCKVLLTAKAAASRAVHDIPEVFNIHFLNEWQEFGEGIIQKMLLSWIQRHLRRGDSYSRQRGKYV